MNSWHWLVAFLACALCSCLDIREEIRVAENGDTSADVRYEFPADALRLCGGEDGVRREIAKLAAANPDLRPLTHTITRENDRVAVALHIGLGKAWRWDGRDDANSDEKGELSRFLGSLDFTRHGRTLDFTRTVDRSAALPGAMFIPANRWAGHNMTTILRLPAPAATHNATRVENGGRTLIWESSTAAAIARPAPQSFSIRIPNSLLANALWDRHGILIVSILLLAALVIAWRVIRRRA